MLAGSIAVPRGPKGQTHTMPSAMNRRVLLRRRPVGTPRPDDFEVSESPIPSPHPGEILCRTLYLSIDPYMRGRMNEGRSYARSVELGQVMVGGTVSQVVESRHPGFASGDFVVGYDGWQAYAVSTGAGVRKLDPVQAPISTALGVLGMPGMTAYVGLLDIGQPAPGETVLVSAAAGAVGSVVGQIARIKGCHVVGIAGSKAKCDYAVSELGFDHCVDYRAQELLPALQAACPGGVDIYFDNVGGAALAAVLTLINRNARELPSGPNLLPVLVSRALIKGFIVSDHGDRLAAFLGDCTRWLREGRLKYREDVVDGLEAAPAALIGVLEGRNFGKMLVSVLPDPTRPS